MQRARETGRINDPVVRQEIAKVLVMSKAAEWTARRARAAQEQGRPQGPEGSLGKLISSHVARAAARVHTQLSGADALLAGADSPMGGTIAEILVSVPAGSIAGGTDEIQRNIIAERVLKMPKEPSIDTDKPFRDVPRNIDLPVPLPADVICEPGASTSRRVIAVDVKHAIVFEFVAASAHAGQLPPPSAWYVPPDSGCRPRSES